MHVNCMRTSVVMGAVLALLMGWMAPPPALADNHIFLPLSGYWDVPTNWNPNQVPADGDNAWIMAGGTTIKTATYRHSMPPSLNDIRIDGSDSSHVLLHHPEDRLSTAWAYVGFNYTGYYSLEEGHLDVGGWLFLGRHAGSHGYFEMLTSGGLCETGTTAVGDEGSGEFYQVSGTHDCGELFIGSQDYGIYDLRGGTLEVSQRVLVGQSADADFDQSGGIFNQLGSGGYGITIGGLPGTQATYTMSGGELNCYSLTLGDYDEGSFDQSDGDVSATSDVVLGGSNGGEGAYTMSGGTLACASLVIANDGDGYFTQTGGDVTTTGDVIVGDVGSHYYQAWYKISQASAAASLHVGGDLRVGESSNGKYEQTGGSVTVDGALEIFGTGNSYASFGPSAGTFKATGSIINHADGYYDQKGGTVEGGSFTNDSTDGVYLGNDAICQTNTLTHNAGTLWMFNNARLRGRLAFPPSTYWTCNFTNNATFQMGSVAANGGTFGGHLTNNGTFTYYQGDFSGSTLTNYGTFNNYAPFTCGRLVNYASIPVTSTRTITAGRAGYANAIENNYNFTINPGGSVTLIDGVPLVNNHNLYAGGTLAEPVNIYGNVVNNGYQLPAVGGTSGGLSISGNYTANSSAELRIRLGGTTAVSQYDRVSIQGTATLGGELDVRLISGFVPSLGNTFTIMQYGSRTGTFSPVYLPTLPSGLGWRVDYLSTSLRLVVISATSHQVDAWRSVRYHGSTAGYLSVELDAAAAGSAATCESRRDGLLRVEVDFDGNVSADYTAGQVYVSGGLSVTGEALVNDGTTLRIDLSGSTDATCYTIDIADSVANVNGDTDCLIRVLAGNTNNDDRTNLADMAQVKLLNGADPKLPGNARYDVNVDGIINLADMALVKLLNGGVVTCPP